MGKINFLFVLSLLILFTGSNCSSSASALKSPSELNTETAEETAEPITISTYIENDPYTDSLIGMNLPEKAELFFFYMQDCELCNELEKFYDILTKELPKNVQDTYPHMIYTINIMTSQGIQTYERMTKAMGISSVTLTPPVLIAGGRVFQGYDTISGNIREAFLTAGEDIFVNHRFYNPAQKKTGKELFSDYSFNNEHAVMVYFYRIVCPFCETVNPIINELPKTVKLDDGREVPLDIIRVNTRSGNNNERIAAFFDKYQVPDDLKTVPIIFFPGTYINGSENILEELPVHLAAWLETGDTNMLAELISR